MTDNPGKISHTYSADGKYITVEISENDMVEHVPGFASAPKADQFALMNLLAARDLLMMPTTPEDPEAVARLTVQIEMRKNFMASLAC